MLHGKTSLKHFTKFTAFWQDPKEQNLHHEWIIKKEQIFIRTPPSNCFRLNLPEISSTQKVIFPLRICSH